MRTSLAIILTMAAPAFADEIGYEELVARLGSAVPTGAGVPIVQVEANESTYWIKFELMWRDYFWFLMKIKMFLWFS